MDGEPPRALNLKHTKELEDDFNNDVFSFVCSVLDDPDEIVPAAREEIQEESEFQLPSGPVSEAEMPPVTVAIVNRVHSQGGVVPGYGKRGAGAHRVENTHSGGRFAPREEGCWVEMGAHLQV